MAKAANKLKKVDGFRTDLVFYLDSDVKMGRLSLLDLNMDVTGTLDFDKEHRTAKGILHVTAMDEEEDILVYMEYVGNVQRVYTSEDNGRTWKLNETEVDPEATVNLFDIGLSDLDKDQLALLSRLSDSFEEYGTLDVHGSEATLYLGNVSLQDFEEVADLSLMRETLSETLQTELTEEDISGIGDMPVIIGLDNDSGMITFLALDMTETMQGIVANAMKTYVSEMVSEDLGGLDLDLFNISIDVNDCEVEAMLYDFAEVGYIVIPDNVRECPRMSEVPRCRRMKTHLRQRRRYARVRLSE